MKSNLPFLVLAVLTMLAGCAAGPTATTEARPSSLATGSNQVSSTRPEAPHQNAPGSFAIADDATLDDLLRYAAEHSPEMRAAFEEWRAGVERGTQARALPDPQLNYGYFVERMETRRTASMFITEWPTAGSAWPVSTCPITCLRERPPTRQVRR